MSAERFAAAVGIKRPHRWAEDLRTPGPTNHITADSNALVTLCGLHLDPRRIDRPLFALPPELAHLVCAECADIEAAQS
jgi:hypothetical protein